MLICLSLAVVLDSNRQHLRPTYREKDDNGATPIIPAGCRSEHRSEPLRYAPDAALASVSEGRTAGDVFLARHSQFVDTFVGGVGVDQG